MKAPSYWLSHYREAVDFETLEFISKIQDNARESLRDAIADKLEEWLLQAGLRPEDGEALTRIVEDA